VTISIIGILSAIGVVSYTGWQKSTITTQLKSDLGGVATAMENARTFDNTYPISLPTTFSSSPDTTLTMFAGADGTNYCIDASSVKDSTLHFYIDQSSGRLGAQVGTCATRLINYNLTIAAGAGGTVNTAVNDSYAPSSTPTITATPNASYVFNNWTGDTGCSGVASHTITMDANKSCTANFTFASNYTLTTIAGSNGTVSAGGSYAPGSTPTITAAPNAFYSFSSWTGDTGCSGIASHTITMDAAKTCTANFTATPIAAPSAPTVTANTVGATTTWSWGAASCPGNTVQYQYHYTISPSGYDSGYGATVSTSIGFTTSTEGQTYTVAIKARCYNTATTSAWSTAGSASYYRPAIITITAIGAITGTTEVGYVLTAGALTPAGATATYQWQTSTTSGGVYTNIPGATSSTYTLVVGDAGDYIKVVATGTGSYTGTVTSAASAFIQYWIAGIGTLTGKWIEGTDLTGRIFFKNASDAMVSPQGAVGLDPYYPSEMSLVNPQTNPAVDFSAYPAQNQCKAIGGHLPTMTQLLAIYDGQASYGNNFIQGTWSWHWSATEQYDSLPPGAGAYFLYFSNGNISMQTKHYDVLVRCIKG